MESSGAGEERRPAGGTAPADSAARGAEWPVRENGSEPRSGTAVIAPAAAAGAEPRRYRHWWWLPGWLFAAVTQLPALLAIAWLVPGFAMLVAGRLTLTPMVIIFVPLAAALCYFAMREIPVSWPRFRPGSADTDFRPGSPAARRPDVRLDSVIAVIVVAAGFAAWQVWKHSQQVLTTGDPGVYLQYGYWIAKHGTARIPQTASAFGPVPGGLSLNFASFGFNPNGSSLTPAAMPGLPLMLAAGEWIHGLSGALLTGPIIGGCAILSFAGLAGRLVGPRWAAPAALVLALTLPQQYAGRTSLSEPLAQVLLFGGLCLIIDSLVVTRRRHVFGDGPGVVVSPGAAMTLAGLGGFAFGLTVLVWIGSLNWLLPAFPVLALMFVARRPQAGPLAMGLFLGVACGLFAGLVLARPYLSSLSSQLHLFGLCAAGFGVATALIAPLGLPKIGSWARRAFVGRPRVPGIRRRLPSVASCLGWVLFAVPILVLAGFAVRPYVQTVRGTTDPYLIRYVASLQRLAGLPVDGRRQYYEASLDWVAWYLGVPAVLLACAGFCLLGHRLVRAVHAWRESAVAARLWALPLLLIGWTVITVLWDPAVVPGQPAASRRLVPVVLPGLVLVAMWACSRLKLRAGDLGARRVTEWAVGLCCVLALAIPAFWTSFSPAVAHGRLEWRGTAVSRTWQGSLSAANSLCAAVGTNATVVFMDAQTADDFAPVVRGLCGQPAALVTGSSGSSGSAGAAGSPAVEQLVVSIERANRRPVLLGASRSALALFGVVPREVVSLQTRTDAAVLTGPPSGTWPFSYTVWMASPLGTGAGI